MKTILFALAAATLALSFSAPLQARQGLGHGLSLGLLDATAPGTMVERRSNRCPSGEPRAFRPGCGGV